MKYVVHANVEHKMWNRHSVMRECIMKYEHTHTHTHTHTHMKYKSGNMKCVIEKKKF